MVLEETTGTLQEITASLTLSVTFSGQEKGQIRAKTQQINGGSFNIFTKVLKFTTLTYGQVPQ